MPYKSVIMPIISIILSITGIIALIWLFISVDSTEAQAQPVIIKKVFIEGYTLDQWCNAIKLAENGHKNKGASYGILSIKPKNEHDARQICKNTVLHKYKTWKKLGCRGRFIDYLGSKFCPLSDKRDKKGINKFWISNVLWGLKHQKGG